MRAMASLPAAPPALRFVARTLYYLAILAALAALYGRGDAPTTGFIYQAF